jgi:vitamin B12 transporter
MNKKNVCFTAQLLLIGMIAFAQQENSKPIPKQKITFSDISSGISIHKLDEVIVSDSKFEIPKEKASKVIVKITAEDLEKKSGTIVSYRFE